MNGAADREPSRPHTVTVLVVDDQASFRRALRELVAATEGFEWIGDASSGEAALAAVDAELPRMVIMDKRMPGIGGIEAARFLTATHPHLVVLLVSLEDPDRRVMAACGAAAFINKRDLSSGVLREVWRDRGPRRA